MRKTTAALTMVTALSLFLCCACAPAPGVEQPQDSASAEPKLESQYYQNGAFAIPEVTPAQPPEACDGFAALE